MSTDENELDTRDITDFMIRNERSLRQEMGTLDFDVTLERLRNAQLEQFIGKLREGDDKVKALTEDLGAARNKIQKDTQDMQKIAEIIRAVSDRIKGLSA